MKRYITNPMIIKELRQRLRERRSWLLPTLYLMVLSGIVVCVYYFSTDTDRHLRGAGLLDGDIAQPTCPRVGVTKHKVLTCAAQRARRYTEDCSICQRGD